MYSYDARVRTMEWGADKAQSGEWSLQEFADFIDICYRLVEEERAGLRKSYTRSEAFQKEERKLIRDCEEAFKLFLAGLEAMMGFADDGEESHLKDGLELYKKGNRLMNKALFYVDDSLEELNISGEL